MAWCPYATLGLERGASVEEVKRAFKRAATLHHPDKHATATAEQQAAAASRFKAAQEAYGILSDGGW